MKRAGRNLCLIAAVALWLSVVGPVANACPQCKDSTPMESASAPPPGSLAKGFAFSILVMMSAPFLLAGGLGAMLYLTLKRSPLHTAPPLSQPAQTAQTEPA